MRSFSHRILAVLFALLVLPAPASAVGCWYQSYRPGSVARFLERHLADWGVAAVPYRFTSPAGQPAGPGTQSLLRSGGLIGTLRYEEEVARGFSQLTVRDADGKIVLEVTETNTVVPPGLERRIAMYTSLQPPTPPAFPFTATLPPLSSYPRFARYGTTVDFATFSTDFNDQLTWLRDVLRTTTVWQPPMVATPFDRLFWAMASDPLVAPYVHRLTFHRGADRWWVRGRVPSNAVYGAILDRGRAAGFPFLAPDMIIDTRTAKPPMMPAPCDLGG